MFEKIVTVLSMILEFLLRRGENCETKTNETKC